MNKVIINGNLVKDMEVRATGKSLVGNFTIANTNGYGDYKKTSFINCTLFGEKRIKGLEKLLLKGAKVLATGAWVQGSYDNKEGKKVYTNEIVIEDIEIEKFVNDKVEEPQLIDEGNHPF